MNFLQKDAFAERERVLENEFFYRVDRQLLKNLRQQLQDEQAELALAMAGHLSGEVLLQELVQLGVKPESLTAISLIPLVLVAWADHRVEPKARLTVLAAAERRGIASDSPAGKLLESWLRTEPDPRLTDAWTRYIQELCGTISEVGKKELHESIMTRAQEVAKSAHGALGFGLVSKAEQKVLQQLDKAFTIP